MQELGRKNKCNFGLASMSFCSYSCVAADLSYMHAKHETWVHCCPWDHVKIPFLERFLIFFQFPQCIVLKVSVPKNKTLVSPARIYMYANQQITRMEFAWVCVHGNMCSMVWLPCFNLKIYSGPRWIQFSRPTQPAFVLNYAGFWRKQTFLHCGVFV